MTLSQTFSLWALRGLIAWALFEGGLSAYDFALARAQQLTTLAGHSEAMTRLQTRARAAESAAATAQARTTGDAIHIWALSQDPDGLRSAAETVRQALIEAGAQSPVVEAALTGAGGTRRLCFSARWREPESTAPLALHTLAARYPDLETASLQMSRADGAIAFSVELETPVALEGATP